MERNLEIFLQQIKWNAGIQIFQEARLERIISRTAQNTIVFELFLPKIMPIADYKLLQDLIKQLPFEAVIHISVKQFYADLNIISDYLNYYLDYFVEKTPFNTLLKEMVLQYEDNTLSIYMMNTVQVQHYTKTKNEFVEFLSCCGINCDVELCVKNDHPLNEKIKNEALEYQKMLTKVQQEVKPEPVKVVENSNHFAKRKQTSKNAKKMMISDFYMELPSVFFEGYVFSAETKTVKNDLVIQTLKVTDYTDSISCTRFIRANHAEYETLKSQNFTGKWVEISGNIQYSSFEKELTCIISRINEVDEVKTKIEDNYPQKRVELHVHSKYSAMDAVSSIDEYIKRAKDYGHSAIAITDHANVQSYPTAQSASEKNGVKMIYGVEFNMIEDYADVVFNPSDELIHAKDFIVFDFETTGLSANFCEIIEIGAIKIENHSICSSFQTFVKANSPISHKISEITNITDEHLIGAPTLEKAIEQFENFCGPNTVLVAHNAKFDIAFLKAAYKKLNREYPEYCVIDTLPLARILYHERKKFALGAVAKFLKVNYDSEVAHRADYDAEVLSRVFLIMLDDLKKNNIETFNQLAYYSDDCSFDKRNIMHVIALAKNATGLKNIFKLVSLSHTKYISKQPLITRSAIEKYRDGLILSSACFNGEVFQKSKYSSVEKLSEVTSFYDYVEIQPKDHYQYLIDTEELFSDEELNQCLSKIIQAADLSNTLIVATGDVHYLDARDQIYRNIYIETMGIGGVRHPLFDFRKRVKSFGDQSFLNTEQMLNKIEQIDKERAIEWVIENSNKIANMTEKLSPIKSELFTPKIDGVDQKLTDLVYSNAYATYGQTLPEIVKQRIEKELDSIIKHGFAVVYYISYQLVKKSLEDGYLVGSRGSVGSSFVATMSEITEVNPLIPHYICTACQFNEFFDDGSVQSGYDLPDKDCPNCGSKLRGEGNNIPFETFLGFEGDKVPDIDLNFSGEYQSVAHAYTKELFGEEYVYRAGTISTVAEKTAYGYVRGYFEHHGNLEVMRKAEIERIAMGCRDVKRTTGQHPGGIIVIPQDMEVYDFTPVQFPADDINSEWKTTHFDFHAIHDNLLKLDILGHVDPTAINMLEKLSGVDAKQIPTNDVKVLSLFSSPNALGITKEQLYKCESGALGIPEFGTRFVRQMLEETKPSTFAELLQISGLSHGTDVWLNNAQSLIAQGTCRLNEVIGCRDDIMVYLMFKNMEPKLAFTIMESVRKGKGLTDEWKQKMLECDVPMWYIESCEKIKYMFPKAHATAYVLMAIRIAWFKVYYPHEYYATYFSKRCDTFDVVLVQSGPSAILERLTEIDNLGFDATPKEKSLFPVLEIAYEMYQRGIKLIGISLEKSDVSDFIVDKESRHLIAPFTALDGLGENVAKSIIEARQDRPFISKEDLKQRTGLNQTSMKQLEMMGVLSDLDETNQMELF